MKTSEKHAKGIRARLYHATHVERDLSSIETISFIEPRFKILPNTFSKNLNIKRLLLHSGSLGAAKKVVSCRYQFEKMGQQTVLRTAYLGNERPIKFDPEYVFFPLGVSNENSNRS